MFLEVLCFLKQANKDMNRNKQRRRLLLWLLINLFLSGGTSSNLYIWGLEQEPGKIKKKKKKNEGFV